MVRLQRRQKTLEVFSIINIRGEATISSKQEYRVNERIRAEKVRLVDENGENVGVVSLSEALRRADDAGLDLVEVAPNADPPVCRIMNYSKFLYEKEKKEREARKSQDRKSTRLNSSH